MARRNKWAKYSFGTDELMRIFHKEINEDKSVSFVSSESLAPLIEVLILLFWQYSAKNTCELGITDKLSCVGGKHFVVNGKIVKIRISYSDIGDRNLRYLHHSNCFRKPYLIEISGAKSSSGRIFRILETLTRQHGFIRLKAIATEKLKKEDKGSLGEVIRTFYNL